MSNIIVFGIIVVLGLLTGWLLMSERLAVERRRIDADIAFMRAIPSDMDWGEQP